MADIAPPPHDEPPDRITFPDLVRIHFRWFHGVRDPATDAATVADLQRTWHEALERFEDEHGRLINAYWCSEVESAVALTAGKPESGWLRRLLSVAPKFHRVSDWATRDEPDIARALHQCDEIVVRATEVLRGRSRRICIQLVMTSACHLLSLIDARGEGDEPADRDAVAAEVRQLAEVRKTYRDSANGDTQLVYFAGMALGGAALGILYLAAAGLLRSEGVQATAIVATLVAGAVGAVVSVIARVNSGSFALEAEIARGYTLFLGTLRPWIGSIFGLLIYMAVKSNFVQLFDVPKDNTESIYFLSVLAFAAGFSERWAQDTLTGGLTGRGRGKEDAVASKVLKAADRRGELAPPPPPCPEPRRSAE